MTSFVDGLIEKFGNQAIWYAHTRSYSPATGAVTETVSTVSVPVAGPFGYDERLIDGSVILDNDQYLLVAADALGYEPAPESHTVYVGGYTYAVVGVTPYEKDDTTLAYEVQVR